MAEPATADDRIGRASALIASGTLVSRVLGFVNITLLAWVIGLQNPGANAFSLANNLPTNLFALIAGGLMSAVLVPQIVRAAGHDDGGQAFVNRLLTLGVSVFLVAGVIATLLAPVLVPLYTIQGTDSAFDAATVRLAIAIAFWCLPQVFFYATYSLLGEVLNARKVFGPYTWAPVVNNLVMIAVLVTFALAFGIDPAHVDPASWTPAQIALLGGGATLGIAAQTVVLMLFWRRTGLRYRPDFRWKGVGLGATGKAAGWTFGMIVITQLTGLLQTNVASLAGRNDPSLAVLSTAWLLFVLPHSILTLSIATPYFTRMSAHAHDRDYASLRGDLSSSLRTILLLVTGAGAAIATAALPFGAFFGRDDAAIVGISSVLIAYLVGLVPFSAMFVLQRTFFALADTRTPFLIQIVQALAFTIAAVAVAVWMPPHLIAVGIALATAVASTVQALTLAVVLRKRIGGLDGRLILVRLAVYLAAAVIAILVGVGALALLGGFSGGFAVADKPSAFVSIAIIGSIVLGVYGAILLATRVPELRAGLEPLRRMAGRIRRR